MPRRRIYLIVIAGALALAVPAVAAAPPEVTQLRRQVTALKKVVKHLTAQRNAARREVAALEARLRPAPRGSVTVSAGTNGHAIRLHGAGVAGGSVLGQMEYLGGVSCEYDFQRPMLRVAATFFNAAGQVVATGSDSESDARAGVRYPLEAYGASGSVRAEVVASVDCL